MADTGISVLDVELIRVGPDDDPADYGHFMEVASDLGARHLIMQLPDPIGAALRSGLLKPARWRRRTE